MITSQKEFLKDHQIRMNRMQPVKQNSLKGFLYTLAITSTMFLCMWVIFE